MSSREKLVDKNNLQKDEERYQATKNIFHERLDVCARLNKHGSLKFKMYLTETMGNTTIEALELSQRATNCLHRVQIRTIGEICETFRSTDELKKIRNCGKRTAEEIMDHLFAYQYFQLKSEKRQKYLEEVIQLNNIA